MINQKYSTKTTNVAVLKVGDQIVTRTNGGSVDTVTEVRGRTTSGRFEFEMNSEYPEFYDVGTIVEIVADSGTEEDRAQLFTLVGSRVENDRVIVPGRNRNGVSIEAIKNPYIHTRYGLPAGDYAFKPRTWIATLVFSNGREREAEIVLNENGTPGCARVIQWVKP